MTTEPGQRGRLCIFARRPVLGTVKTRLAAEVGDEAALAAHIALTEGTLARCVAPSDYDTELWLAGSPGEPDAVLKRWFERYDVVGRDQPAGDLGERMRIALEDSPGPAVLIGSDLLGIDSDYIGEALLRLATADVVLGPAEDGGYGLIGASKAVPELFIDVDWGTNRVYGQTRARARAAGLSVAVLGMLKDVDTPEDWRKWQRSRKPSP